MNWIDLSTLFVDTASKPALLFVFGLCIVAAALLAWLATGNSDHAEDDAGDTQAGIALPHTGQSWRNPTPAQTRHRVRAVSAPLKPSYDGSRKAPPPPQ